ncbi:MAG: alpha/beta fold hydrolase [Chloroflexi bacterium]|nr:alpha/beta fold hydrolase [Chloroflexota bacterium]
MTPNKKRWRNLALFFGSSLLVGTLIIIAFIVAMTVRLTGDALRPARTAIEQTPPDVGLDDYQTVTFTTRDDLELHGWYIPPQNGAVIILLHGFGGNRQDLLPEAAVLANAGYGVLLFDLRAHGESDGSLVTFGQRERWDLAAAVDFVLMQPGVDAERLGAVGFSMGGATLALFAADDDRLRAVVIEAAFPVLEDVIRSEADVFGPLTEWPAVWTVRRAGIDFDLVRPVDALCAISPRPLLLLYGEADEVVSPAERNAMLAAACDPVERWVVPGAGHQNYTEVIPEVYTARLLSFFDQALGFTDDGSSG